MTNGRCGGVDVTVLRTAVASRLANSEQPTVPKNGSSDNGSAGPPWLVLLVPTRSMRGWGRRGAARSVTSPVPSKQPWP